MAHLPAKIAASKFDFEFMGKSIKAIADTYDLTEDQVKFHMEQDSWQRRIEPQEIEESRDLKTYAENLAEVAKSRLSIIAIVRQIDQQPLIAELEKLCLDKAMELVAELMPEDPRSPNKLKTIVEAVNLIQKNNPVPLGEQLQKALEAKPGLTVNIQNNIQ